MEKNQIVNQIFEVVNDIIRGYDDYSGGWIEKHQAADKKLHELEAKLGPGLQEGRLISFQVADGYAVYVITKVQKRVVKVHHVPLYDGYTSQAVYNNTLQFGQAQQLVDRQDALRELFKKNG